MIEILPNWHPIFVHFTVALFTTSVAFYILTYLFNMLKIYPIVSSEFEVVSRWCLWLAGIIVIPTVWAGLYAYNTVQHDTPSHIAMTNHRNWALPTAVTMLLVVLWSCWRTYKLRTITFTYIVVLIIVQGLLTATSWRGAELVFRYGLGVLSIPQSEGAGHPQDAVMMENMPKDQPRKMKNQHEQGHVH